MDASCLCKDGLSQGHKALRILVFHSELGYTTFLFLDCRGLQEQSNLSSTFSGTLGKSPMAYCVTHKKGAFPSEADSRSGTSHPTAPPLGRCTFPLQPPVSHLKLLCAHPRPFGCLRGCSGDVGSLSLL